MEERLNFSEIAALVVDGDRFSTGILGQILRGFGLARHVIVGSGEEAKKLLSSGRYDLLITECLLEDMSAADLIHWTRRQPDLSLRTIPIIMLTGYTHYSRVTGARDSGVNTVVRKPVAPIVLFDRIAWSATADRPFIDADEYAGPDRRFRFDDPAPRLNRRVSDREPDVNAPEEAST